MTTNYGERPGIVLDGDANYWRGKVAEVERERDAAREEAARLRAAIRELTSFGRTPDGAVLVGPQGWDALLNVVRATEAGKDGAL